MSARLTHLLEHVLAGEPALGDEVEAVFREAERLRRRRTRRLIAAGGGVTAVVAVVGYLLATTLLAPAPPPAGKPAAKPAAPARPAATPSSGVSVQVVPSSVADPVLALIAPVVDGKKMHIYPRSPERGSGWRQYRVVDKDGKPRGNVAIAVYTVAEDLCFPVLAAPSKCARTSWAPAGVEFARYDDSDDPDRQVRQTIARRISDGRTIALMSTGERDTGSAARGKPALSGKQVETISTDRRIFDAFGPAERCTGPASGTCPVFTVPVPLTNGD